MVLNRDITERIREVLEKHPEGISITDLVRSVDVNRNTAGRYLETLLHSGQVEMRRFGMAKMYSLTKRLPVSSVLSISSDLILQLDAGQRVIYANEPLLRFLGAPAKDLFGKNIEFTPFAIVFEEVFPGLADRFRRGLKGDECRKELSRPVQGRSFFCRITPTVSNEGKKGVSVLLEDISDQKRDAERIRKSEVRLRSIFKVSPVGIGVVADRGVLEVNDRICRMTGYAEHELVGKSVRLLYPSSDEFERVIAHQDSQMQRTGAGSIETKWVKKNGTVIDILLSSTPLDPANFSGGITFTALDITERKMAEQALRVSEERYRSLFENTGAATAIVEANTLISLVNGEFERLSGYTKREIENKKSWTEFIVKEDLDRMLAQHHLRRKDVNQALRRYEFGYRTKSGKVRQGILTIDMIPGTQQSVTSLMDITDRKLTEEQLRQREQQYRFIADNSLDIITIMTPEYICTYISPAITLILGYPEMEVVGTSLLNLVHPDDLDRIPRDPASIARNGVISPLTFRLRHRNGHYLWFETMTTVIWHEKTGHLRELLSISRDITARRPSGEETAGEL